MSSRLSVKSKIKKKLYFIQYNISILRLRVWVYGWKGFDMVDHTASAKHLILPPPHNIHTYAQRDRGGCINRNRKRTPSGSHYALTWY